MSSKEFVGKGQIKELLPILKTLQIRHVFLVRGKNSYKSCGASNILIDVFSHIGCNITEFYDFSENPKFEDVERGVALLRQFNVDIIIAVGGGSVMDMAKLIRFFNSYSGDIKENKYNKEKELIPIIAIPTTAGTGAEVTHFSVVYKDNVKYSAEHNDILPDYAIIDPQFTYDNPKYLTACTGFDALAQAIESYWNLNATIESDMYAEKALRLLWPNLPKVVNYPNEKLRDMIAEGAYWAGRAINITKTTAPHAFSYPYTTYYGYPHGHAVALTFPFFMNVNCGKKNSDTDRIHSLLSILNVDSGTDLQKMMQSYIDSIGLCQKGNKLVDNKFILEHINLNRLRNNPVELDNEIRDNFISQL